MPVDDDVSNGSVTEASFTPCFSSMASEPVRSAASGLEVGHMGRSHPELDGDDAASLRMGCPRGVEAIPPPLRRQLRMPLSDT